MNKKEIEAILDRFGVIMHTQKATALRKNSIACVALPTCPLALAESQRYLPSLLSKIEPLLVKHRLEEDDIILRMTGCPNGCARPGAAEIAFVGTAFGKYNMYLGGDRIGLRLNKLYKENLEEAAILDELDNLFGVYTKDKKKGETFGDFTYRTLVGKV